MVIILISCKKDKINTAIIGTWELSTTHILVVDSTVIPISKYIYDTTFTHNHSYTYQFKADTVIYTDYTQVLVQVDTGQYNFSSGVLVIFGTSGGYNDLIGNCNVSNNILTLTISDTNPGSYSSLTETFIRQ
jgi:hypothetical protein